MIRNFLKLLKCNYCGTSASEIQRLLYRRIQKTTGLFSAIGNRHISETGNVSSDIFSLRNNATKIKCYTDLAILAAA